MGVEHCFSERAVCGENLWGKEGFPERIFRNASVSRPRLSLGAPAVKSPTVFQGFWGCLEASPGLKFAPLRLISEALSEWRHGHEPQGTATCSSSYPA